MYRPQHKAFTVPAATALVLSFVALVGGGFYVFKSQPKQSEREEVIAQKVQQRQVQAVARAEKKSTAQPNTIPLLADQSSGSSVSEPVVNPATKVISTGKEITHCGFTIANLRAGDTVVFPLKLQGNNVPQDPANCSWDGYKGSGGFVLVKDAFGKELARKQNLYENWVDQEGKVISGPVTIGGEIYIETLPTDRRILLEFTDDSMADGGIDSFVVPLVLDLEKTKVFQGDGSTSKSQP